MGIPDNLKKEFPEILSIKQTIYSFKGIPDPWWISGFTSGDGSLNLKIGNNSTTSLGWRVQLRFSIGLHIRELELIKGIASYFNLLYPIDNSGNLSSLVENTDKRYDKFKTLDVKYKYISTTSQVVSLQITKFSDIITIIIPFFDKYPLQGQKDLKFKDFKAVSQIMKTNDHLNIEGFKKILKIKNNNL